MLYETGYQSGEYQVVSDNTWPQEDYIFNWSCSSNIGTSSSEYNGSYTISEDTPVGNYTLTLRINDGTNEIYNANTVVKIVENVIENDLSILTLGDSLTNNKPWLNNLVSLSNNKIKLVGTRGSNGIFHEGRSGFTSVQYLNKTGYQYEETEDVHPFYNSGNGRFDWNYYKTSTGISADAIVIFLGTNGLASDPTGNANCIKQIIDYIRQDDSNIPIFLVNTIYGKIEGKPDLKAFNLMTRLNQLVEETDNINIVPLTLTHDSVNNFNSTDTVHPDPLGNGYNQFANTIYSAICGYINE